MNKKFIGIIVLLLFKLSFLNCQNLSKQEAYSFSEKLYKIDILSEKGFELLKKDIKENNFERNKRRNLTDGSVSVSSDLSVSQILIFLTNAFSTDMHYRSGILEQQKYVKDLQKEKGIGNVTQEDYENLSVKMDSLLKTFVGFQIEEKIKDEDNFSQGNIRGFTGAFPISMDYDLISHKRSVMGKNCTKTLNDLLTIGLIDDRIYKEVKPRIGSHELFTEFFLLAAVTERVIYYEDFKGNKDIEMELIKNLHKNGIISNENLELLMQKNDGLLNKYDLIGYCHKAKIFQLKNYSPNPEIGFSEIFEEIKTILPDFEFYDFKAKVYEVENQWDEKLIEYKAKISFEVEGISYGNEFFYDFKKKTEEKTDPILQIHNGFHIAVNKFLADRNSEYRLYFANKVEQGKGVYGKEEFGLILLTKEQFKAWGTYNSDYFLFEQSHDNSFNTTNINNCLATYERIGLFKHLSQAEIKQGYESVTETQITSYESILSCFPKTVVYFDWETGNLENPYKELTMAFSHASRGAFLPTNIKDDFKNSWEKKTVDYSFEFSGKLYQEKLEMQNDWLDPQFMSLMEKALKESNIDGEIHYCLDNGQAAGYIFLSKEQYKYLKENQPTLFPEY